MAQVQAELLQGATAYAMFPKEHLPGMDPADAGQAPDVVRPGTEPELPQEYRDFQDVFSAEGAGILPPHSEYDHAIDTQGKQPPHRPIYNLAQHELKALREYLETSLAKGWIQPS